MGTWGLSTVSSLSLLRLHKILLAIHRNVVKTHSAWGKNRANSKEEARRRVSEKGSKRMKRERMDQVVGRNRNVLMIRYHPSFPYRHRKLQIQVSSPCVWSGHCGAHWCYFGKSVHAWWWYEDFILNANSLTIWWGTTVWSSLTWLSFRDLHQEHPELMPHRWVLCLVPRIQPLLSPSKPK